MLSAALVFLGGLARPVWAFFKLPVKVPIGVLIGAALLAVVLNIGHGNARFKAGVASERNAVAEAAKRDAAKRTTITVRAETEAVKSRETIRTINRTIVREVPRYVTREADSRCVVPVGAVRVLNAAARNVPLSETPGVADDAPAAVGLAELTGQTVENYGLYHEVADRLTRLQAWIREQQRLNP